MREELYQGREQTEVKHRILERYLSAFVPIVGAWASDIAYVDCLAGPWEARGENLEDTSFSRSIEVLRKAKAGLAFRGKSPSLRCLLVEGDRERFQRLSAFARTVTDIEVTTRNWDFEYGVSNIVSFAKLRKNSFPFFFIDPTGWELVTIDLIRPILSLGRCEILINLMTSWIKRFLSDESKNFERLLGPGVGRLRELQGDEQEEELVRCYADAVRRAGHFSYVCTLPVLKAEADMFHFWMVYGTRHPKGVEEFKNTERVVIPFMHEIRAEAQNRKRFLNSGGQYPLLQPTATYVERRLTRLQQKNLEDAKSELASFMNANGELRFDDIWAKAMQFSLVGESDLKEWIADWVKDKRIELRNMRPGERVPKRNSGHMVKWVRGSAGARNRIRE